MTRAALLLALGLAGAAWTAAGADTLAPSQLVRSLQLVQDRVASGDHAALAMQRKLLNLIDERLRAGDASLLAQPREWEAALIYAMSGGNPATVEALMPELVKDENRRDVALGVFNNLRGTHAPARQALAKVDPLTFSAPVGAYLCLVKGSLLAGLDAPAALALFDQARLLAPGTLVEEAALRRSMALAAETGDGGRFLAASARYARRFLLSPYAGEFADGFVSGVVALRDSLDLDDVADVTGAMDPERRRVILLRIARRAAIEHAVALSDFAAEQAKGEPNGGDARAKLYAALPNVAAADPGATLATLEGIDAAALADDDRALLQAARQVARGLQGAADTPLPAVGAPPPAAGPEQGASPGDDDKIAAARRAMEAVDRLLETVE